MKYLAFCFGLILCVSVSGQNLFIKLNSGTLIFSISNVEKITFTGDTLNLHKSDGTYTLIDIDAISFMQYKNDGSGVSSISAKDNIAIYPIPVQNILTIEWKEAEGRMFSSEIYDAYGRCIMSVASERILADTLHLDMHGYPPGTYILRLISPTQLLTKSFVLL